MMVSDLAELSMCEVKQGYAERIKRQIHRRDSSSLILQLDDSPNARELVLYYPRINDVRAPAAETWWYPHDPFLPGLERILTDRRFVATASRDQASPEADPRVPATSVRQLGYHPGQRATVLLSCARWPTSLVVKLVRPAAFGRALHIAAQIEGTRSRNFIDGSRFVAWSTAHAALVYEFAPGTPVKKVAAAGRNELSSQAAAALRSIHAAPLPDLPLWNPRAELAQSRSLIRPLRSCAPAAGDALERGLDALSVELTWSPAHPRVLVHNDFSSKNLIWNTRAKRLAVIDWDRAVLGPVERDVASMFAVFGTSPWRHVDMAHVNWITSHQKLLKSARRALAAAHLS